MEIRFQVDAGGFVRVEVAGRIDIADGLRLARQITEYGDGEARSLPILLDVREVRVGLSILDMVELVNVLLAEIGRYQRRLALLSRGDDQIERAQFMQNYSSNRGIPIAAFSDYHEAVRWLTR